MSYPTLQLGDVYAVVNYYLQNRTEVDAYISKREAEAGVRDDPVLIRFCLTLINL